MNSVKNDIVSCAYDKDGRWWFEEDIKCFTGGIIRMSFGKEREHIKIIEIKRSKINYGSTAIGKK